MSWVTVAIAGGLGAYKGIKNEERMAANDKFRKAAITYSPWTGMSDPGSVSLPGVLESGVQGAAMGATLGNALGTGGAAGSTGAGVGAAGQNSLGGVDMANKLGAQFGGAQNLQLTSPEMLTANSLGADQMSAQLGQQYGQPIQMGSPGSLQLQNPMMARYSSMKY